MLRKKSLFRVIFMLLVFPLFPREITVTVEDADLGIPLEGAAITVSGGVSGGAEYVCDAAGTARVTIPDDRPGVIRVGYPGYESQRLAAPAGGNALTVRLRLGGVMENAELVLEESRPGASETRSGRSVAISGEELSRTAEIGLIEDVMNSIKLLPGVGYAGMFNAQPSIRGGDPGDLMAALDGFYLSHPYHWGGGVSIFDPRMVSSAQLSHGVFSTRYGHTISGFLEVTSRRPDPGEAEFELGLSTSATSINLSYPINGKGGVMFMGKVTYWDTLVWAAKALANVWTSNETLQLIHSVSTAPYIRSASLSSNYRFTGDLELTLNGFFGSDGVGAAYRNSYDDDEIKGNVNMDFNYYNYQGFGIISLIANPFPSMVIKATAGAGFTELAAEGSIRNDVEINYNQGFLDVYKGEFDWLDDTMSYRAPDGRAWFDTDYHATSVQGRADIDWDLGRGFLAAFGVQELYNRWKQKEAFDIFIEQPVSAIIMPPGIVSGLEVANAENGAIIWPFTQQAETLNQGFTSSAYTLLEWKSPGQAIGAETGLRVDHLYFIGRDGAGGDPFSVQSMPVLNPRLNLDFGILKNAGIVDSLGLTAGTGLFSSVNDAVAFTEKRNGIEDFDLKPNRSWTSVIGTKIDFFERFSFNIEAYYKYIFDRAYISTDVSGGSSAEAKTRFYFNGEGRIFGVDLQLQKLQSRFWDGWISYTFTHALYHEPDSAGADLQGTSAGERQRDDWYYPAFHRFHNFNLVLNIKPVRHIGIGLRFGFASGRPVNKAGSEIVPYPVEVAEFDENTKAFEEKKWDEDKQDFVPVDPADPEDHPTIIQKYRRDSYYDRNERGPWSFPLDLKVSFFMFDRKGRVRTEIYLAMENILSFISAMQEVETFNQFTGRVDTGANLANYGLPVPMISFGFKWSY
ncbi:MAG: TonB-dependent receptor [Treponema sp.]|jgi:hypothetical protein|nr:TonB-dependent receptor [Treponema sp.]